MSDSPKKPSASIELLEHTARIVAAYAGNATLSPTELTEAIRSVSSALNNLGTASTIPKATELVPAVPVKKSVTADFIICLEDGKKLKMLKRHLMSTYKMTPQDYRVKWSLPRDYPMVAPNYAATRSQLAKKIGLGKSLAKVPAPIAAPVLPAKRGRPKKVAA